MTNAQGTPVWYELLAADPDAAARFYGAVIGWTVGQPSCGMDYRMIDAGGGDFAGGVMQLTGEMQAAGARPTWLFYIGVDDVDATARTIEEAGGRVIKPAWTIEGIGHMALVADPQGIPFYILRGEREDPGRAWDREALGKCNWNELSTPDPDGAHRFYSDVFGWTYPDSMPIPGVGDYTFIEAGRETIGATMPKPPEVPVGLWQFYFRADDIDRAAAAVRDGGGTVLMEPQQVPGGSWIIVALDPEGAPFGVLADGGQER